MFVRVTLIVLACFVVTLIAILTATVAGYLSRRDGSTYPTAFSRAAIAFSATLTLAASVTMALASVIN